MASARFFLFIVLIAFAGALLATWLFPIVKRWWMKYQTRVEQRSRQVDEDIEDMQYDDNEDEEDQKTYY